jgi:nitrite reductase/ring-hydroxylating ferredoxin subunit
LPGERSEANVAYEEVARVEDVPDGRGLRVRIGGIDVGLFRVADEICAIENQCPHAGDPLSEGLLEGSIVTCRAHGWRFDVRTGFRPSDADGFRSSDADGFPIPRFAVRIVEGAIEVDLESPLNRPPQRG